MELSRSLDPGHLRKHMIRPRGTNRVGAGNEIFFATPPPGPAPAPELGPLGPSGPIGTIWARPFGTHWNHLHLGLAHLGQLGQFEPIGPEGPCLPLRPLGWLGPLGPLGPVMGPGKTIKDILLFVLSPLLRRAFQRGVYGH